MSSSSAQKSAKTGRGMSAALFVSDLHLCPTRPKIARQFLAFLNGPGREAQALYILGDLFEYWAGDDDLSEPFNAEIVGALKNLTEHGTGLFFLRGNRDFLAGEGFARASGAVLLEEPHLFTLFGKPTLLMHGDTLCSDDVSYQEFREEVRSQAWRDAFLAQPLGLRKKQIEALRKRSEQAKQVKPASIMDVNAGAVANLLQRYRFPLLIHGHTHRQAHHESNIDGQPCERWVLGDWFERGSYLACDEEGCRAAPWPPAA